MDARQRRCLRQCGSRELRHIYNDCRHAFGNGRRTFNRRNAWILHCDFPCVLLSEISQKTAFVGHQSFGWHTVGCIRFFRNRIHASDSFKRCAQQRQRTSGNVAYTRHNDSSDRRIFVAYEPRSRAEKLLRRLACNGRDAQRNGVSHYVACGSFGHNRFFGFGYRTCAWRNYGCRNGCGKLGDLSRRIVLVFPRAYGKHCSRNGIRGRIARRRVDCNRRGAFGVYSHCKRRVQSRVQTRCKKRYFKKD